MRVDACGWKHVCAPLRARPWQASARRAFVMGSRIEREALRLRDKGFFAELGLLVAHPCEGDAAPGYPAWARRRRSMDKFPRNIYTHTQLIKLYY